MYLNFNTVARTILQNDPPCTVAVFWAQVASALIRHDFASSLCKINKIISSTGKKNYLTPSPNIKWSQPNGHEIALHKCT